MNTGTMIQPMSLLEAGSAADYLLLLDGDVLKLFRPGIPRDVVSNEVTGIQAAQTLGVKTPVIRELVEYQERFGIIIKRLHGPTMLETVLLNPDQAEEMGRQMAAFHADLHTRGAAQRFSVPLPEIKDALRYEIPQATALPQRIHSAALAALDALPSGTALCPGDLHPHNLIMTPDGPVILDWSATFLGCPAADVARTVLLLRHLGLGHNAEPEVLQAIDKVRAPFHEAYFHHYSELRPTDAEQVGQWLLPVAVAHLTAPLPDLVRQTILAWIESLLPRS